MTHEETWKPMVDSFLYLISDKGNIKRASTNVGPKIQPRLEDGIAYVQLPSHNNTTAYFYALEKLVFETFVMELQFDTYLVHLDGNPMNCAVDNLALPNA